MYIENDANILLLNGFAKVIDKNQSIKIHILFSILFFLENRCNKIIKPSTNSHGWII